MNRRPASLLLSPLLLGAAVLLSSCGEYESPTEVSRISSPSLLIVAAQTPGLELVALCKAGPVGIYTFRATATHPVLLDESTGLYNLTSADYTVTVTPGSVVEGSTIPGACWSEATTGTLPPAHNHIALTGGTIDATVTVVETGMPAGLVFEKAELYLKTHTQSNNTTTFTMTTTTTNSAAVRTGGDGQPLGSRTLWGSSIIFYDVVEAPGLSVGKTAAGTYDIPVSWQLTKSVSPTSHTGTAGQTAGTSTWAVTATRTDGSPTNHVVSGAITVSNPAGGVTRDFTVVDTLNTTPKTAATVTCPKYTIDPGEDVVCTYTVAAAGATLNTATVSVAGMADVSATAAVTYTLDKYTGDETVTLADPRLSVSQVISSTTTLNIPETFACPAASASYVNGSYTRTEPNTATLTGTNTNLTRSAQVVVNCTVPPARGETATGAGFPWKSTQGAPNNWFMYTPWATTGGHRGISAAASGNTPAGTNLLAGKTNVAGRITGTRGATTSITITLNSTFKFGSDVDNVKIHPMSCTTGQPYVQPGKHTVKHTASVSATSFTVTGLSNTACYGIHVSVEWN